MGHGGGVRYIHMQCSRLGTPAVNHIYYVYLRWGLRIQRYGGLVVGEYGGGWRWMGKVLAFFWSAV